MFIDNIAKRTCRYIADVIPLRGTNPVKVAKNVDEVVSARVKVDSFEHIAEEGVPKRLQAILDDIGSMGAERKEFLTDLYKHSPSKFDYIYNYKYFDEYPIFNDKEFLKAVETMPEKEIVKTFDEIEDLYKSLPEESYNYDKVTNELLCCPQTPDSTNLAQLTILKANNKEAYEYLLNHPNKESVSNLLHEFSEGLNGSALETLTVPQIRQIECVGRAVSNTDINTLINGSAALSRYVLSSDMLVKNASEVENLSKFLGNSKVIEQFTAFRGNRDTGMFNSIVLDSSLAQRTKLYVLKNLFKAKKVQVHDYTGQYETHFSTKTNLFKYIMNKKDLTLADAMQVAKYGDESYRNKIIELIKKSQIEDTRFKSLTFDRNMATTWMPELSAKTPEF